MEKILLVNNEDKETGFCEKIKAHKEGILHRAFSILIFNLKGEILIQKREINKYHSGGLWSNACCSHQKKGEMLDTAIHRRLKEELGFDCELNELFSFRYTHKFDNGLIENELDHVFIGFHKRKINLNLKEASEFKWLLLSDLIEEVHKNPKSYTYWFRIIIKKFLNEILLSLHNSQRL
jgi:isopentenyl-diphosphate delta-isomerase